MHNNRIRLPGGWTDLSVLTAAEMELFDEAQYLSIHEGGGTWALMSSVTVGAQGSALWNFTLPLIANNLAGHVTTANTLSVDKGGTLDLVGLLKVEEGAMIQVFGQAGLPGVIQLGAYAGLTLGANATLYAFQGSAVQIYSSVLYETGGTWRLLEGSQGFVDGNASIILAGSAANNLALLDVQEFGQIMLRPGAGCELQNSATLLVDLGARIMLSGALVFEQSSTLTGTATLTNDATLTANGAQGHNASIIVGTYGELNFTGGAITGKPKFTGPTLFAAGVEFSVGAMQFDANTTLRFMQGSNFQLNTGSMFENAATTTRTGPEIRQGATAATGLRVFVGPDADWDIDGEAYDYILIPSTLLANRTWRFKAATHTVEVEIAQSSTTQGNNLQVLFGGTPLGNFVNDGAANYTATVKYQWDGTRWRVKGCTETAGNVGGGSALKMPQ
jgi:hypothetical protein